MFVYQLTFITFNELKAIVIEYVIGWKSKALHKYKLFPLHCDFLPKRAYINCVGEGLEGFTNFLENFS